MSALVDMKVLQTQLCRHKSFSFCEAMFVPTVHYEVALLHVNEHHRKLRKL